MPLRIVPGCHLLHLTVGSSQHFTDASNKYLTVGSSQNFIVASVLLSYQPQQQLMLLASLVISGHVWGSHNSATLLPLNRLCCTAVKLLEVWKNFTTLF